MAEVKITDLVPQETIDKIKELNTEMQTTLGTYSNVARELAKGIDIPVKGLDDLERMQQLLAQKSREAATANRELTRVVSEQSQVIANTTNTISRQLMEQERVNKAQREAYTEHEKVKQLLDHFHDTYENQVASLSKLNLQLKANKESQKDNEKALASGLISMQQFTQKQSELIAQHRALTQEKRTLTQIMTAEEKAAQSTEGSYVQMSQQLELLKKAYKGLSEEGRTSDFGKELESAIQNLDAHLKDTAADMGEFQRNVGNYAIAGQNGVVATESLNAVLSQQAVTTKDLADQSKILTEAKSMLDTADANYSETVEAINAKLAENKRRLSDVSDIMDVQATSVAEAEAQNQRLTEALKNVDLTSEDAAATTAALTAKIDENNRIIEENTTSKASLKKDLKELVLEIANLSLQYSSLTKEEQTSAQGQELKQHIDELIEKAGELKDAIADTNQAISNAASDTRGFDQMSAGIQLAIDGFGLASGAAEMLGISEGELAQIQTKLMAAIAASNAMSKIQNALQKQGVLLQAANLIQTKLRTVAENLHTAAKGKGVVATNAATVAQWAFNAAANANPIGLIVLAIVACVAAVWGLVKAFQAFTGPSAEATAELDRQLAAVDNLREEHEYLIKVMEASGTSQAKITAKKLEYIDEEIAAMTQAIQTAINNDAEEEKIAEAKEARAERQQELLDEYSTAYFSMTKLIKEEADEELRAREGDAFVKKKLIDEEIDGQIELVRTMRAVAAVYGYSAQQLDDILVALEKRRKRLKDKVDADENKSASDRAKKSRDAAKRAADQLKKEVQKGEDALLKVISDSLERQRAAENLSYKRKRKDLEDALRQTKQTESTLREALNRQIEGLEAEHSERLRKIYYSERERWLSADSEFIQSHLAVVESGSEEELALRKRQLMNERDQELVAITKKEEEHTLTKEQADEMRANVSLKYARRETETVEEFAAKKAEAVMKQAADEQEMRDAAHVSEMAAIDKAYAEKLAAANGNEAKIAAATEDYNRKKAQAERDYAEQTARASIASIEQVLNTEDLSAEDRLAAERALAAAKAHLEKTMAENAIAATNEVVEADTKATAERLANAQKWLQVAADGLNAINDLTSAIFDAKIERIEAEQEANTEAGEAEQERISELVEKNVITEEEGEARKRAAEAATAKKNEELERKKQQLKIKQAKWDKANSLAQAGIATALAITQALPNIVLAAIAGAMGAIQIATILATPIPKYAKGTKDHPGGPAIVGDGGQQEVVLMNGSAWLTPDKPTLVDIPRGAEVIPGIAEYNRRIEVTESPVVYDRQTVVSGYNDRDMRRCVGELASLIKQNTKERRAIASRQEYELFKSRI